MNFIFKKQVMPRKNPCNEKNASNWHLQALYFTLFSNISPHNDAFQLLIIDETADDNIGNIIIMVMRLIMKMKKLNMIIFIVRKMCITKMATSGTDIVHHWCYWWRCYRWWSVLMIGLSLCIYFYIAIFEVDIDIFVDIDIIYICNIWRQ